MEKMEKPPLGVKPKWLHDKERLIDMLDAMQRYSEAKIPINLEWVHELWSLVNQYVSLIGPKTEQEHEISRFIDDLAVKHNVRADKVIIGKIDGEIRAWKYRLWPDQFFKTEELE